MNKLTRAALIISTAIFLSSCGGDNNKNNTPSPESPTSTAEAAVKLETNLDPILGCYKHYKGSADSWSVGKFPVNTKVRFSDHKFFPFDKKYIGKYYMVQYCFGLDTNEVIAGRDSYCVPEYMGMGNILLGVDQNGNMHIQNYSISENGMEVGRESTFGQLLPNENGGYSILVNNSKYELKAKN
ncbi:MAG: hypothetical protein V4635_09525 [Bacteroidota bacterium]